MKQVEDTIPATLFIEGPGHGFLGDFAFSVLPRVGELVLVPRDGKHETYRVTEVTHLADNVSATVKGLREVQGPSVHLACKEV